MEEISEKVTSYDDPPPSSACGAGFDIMTPPLIIITPPFQNFCRLSSIRKGNECTYYTKKARRRRKFL